MSITIQADYRTDPRGLLQDIELVIPDKALAQLWTALQPTAAADRDRLAARLGEVVAERDNLREELAEAQHELDGRHVKISSLVDELNRAQADLNASELGRARLWCLLAHIPGLCWPFVVTTGWHHWDGQLADACVRYGWAHRCLDGICFNRSAPCFEKIPRPNLPLDG